MRVPAGRQGILLAVILLACFLGVDRFLVRARTRAFANAESAMHAAEDRLYRARTEATRTAAIAAVLGESGESAGRTAPIAIDYLNGLVAARGLRTIDLGNDAGAQRVKGEPVHLTVQGSYERLVLFLRDLESSRVPVWLREVRISGAEDGSALEMRVRLEIEGTTS